ncbi:MAG: phosphoadenylyl-sulfate reductase, partial [Acetobacteraceae bacterium]|nr:phosphoadenylyl-sulfate reductase [Acetobacteraceae bacterium]
MSSANPSVAAELDAAFRSIGPRERLKALRDRVGGELVFTTSFGLEDQVLLHLIAGAGIRVGVVTLDTGRLFPQTYALWARTEARYGLAIRAVYPETYALESLVAQQGIDGFYQSKKAREACCGVRKLEPLGRALQGASAWITGLRANQSAVRGGMTFVSFDPVRGLLKANPLLDWTRERIAALAREEDVPVNP